MSAGRNRCLESWRGTSDFEQETTVCSFVWRARASSWNALDIGMDFMMSNLGHAQTLVLDGKRFVILPEADYQRMVGLPPTDAKGNRPAVAAMRAVLARDI